MNSIESDITSRKRKRKSRSEKNKKAKLDSDATVSSTQEQTSIKDETAENSATPTISSEGFETFEMLEGRISNQLLKAIKKLEFKNCTEIQALSLPILLNGKDLIGAAKTGSGKTLAFLIPAIQFLHKKGFSTNFKGTGVIIISPTRELSNQTYKVLTQLLEYHPEISHGIIMGENSKQDEKKKFRHGVNILVATPGRLLDHLKNTIEFDCKNLKCLILDEADKILGDGFEKQLNEILALLPKQRQTILFSATMNVKTEALVKVALKADHKVVKAGDNDRTATVIGLKQKFAKAPPLFRFTALLSILYDYKGKKVIVFFNTCNSVIFHSTICKEQAGSLGNIDTIHGKMSQENRSLVFEKFCAAKSGMLFCTDLAARGLDIPFIQVVVQYEPPKDIKEYIHRVGRTARGEGAIGEAIILLQPHELSFCQHLVNSRIPIDLHKLYFKENITPTQRLLEKSVEKDPQLQEMAVEAFQTYFKSYNLLHLKTCFEVMQINQEEMARSFGLKFTPELDIGLNQKKYKIRKKNQMKKNNW